MRSLGALEAEVMRRLWVANAPMSVREVLAELTRDKELAYTTVMTVLENLHRKGLVCREKDGRAFLYTVTMSREQYTAELMDGVLEGTSDRGAALMYFVQRMSSREQAELRDALERLHAPEDGA